MFVFDGFHVFGEGHANLALVKLRDILSKSVRSSFSSQLWLDHHARRPEGPSLRDPLNSPKDWTGVEKEHFAINLANVLLPYFHPRGIYAPPGDPDESEQALASFFRQGTKDKPVRVKIGCNLLGVEYATARLGREDWAWSDWRAYFAQRNCPWRRFYTDYVVPLSDLLLLLHRPYCTTRDCGKGGRIELALKAYTSGYRLVFGEADMSLKLIFHKAAHMAEQAARVGGGLVQRGPKPMRARTRTPSRTPRRTRRTSSLNSLLMPTSCGRSGSPSPGVCGPPSGSSAASAERTR